MRKNKLNIHLFLFFLYTHRNAITAKRKDNPYNMMGIHKNSIRYKKEGSLPNPNGFGRYSQIRKAK